MTKVEEYDVLSDWYDTLWPGVEDLSFYLDLANRDDLSILELGCGTGRLSCEFAKNGYHTLGIDISPRMLQRANSRKSALRLQDAALVEFELANMTNFGFVRRFGLIIAPFSTIFELASSEDRAATYRSCLAHLTDRGTLVIDNWFKGSGDLADWGRPRPQGIVSFLGVRQHPLERDSVVQHFEVQEYGPGGLMELTILLDEVNTEGLVRRRTFTVVRHYVEPEQTQLELKHAGFKNVDTYGGFRREPLYDVKLRGRGRQIFVARP